MLLRNKWQRKRKLLLISFHLIWNFFYPDDLFSFVDKKVTRISVNRFIVSVFVSIFFVYPITFLCVQSHILYIFYLRVCVCVCVCMCVCVCVFVKDRDEGNIDAQTDVFIRVNMLQKNLAIKVGIPQFRKAYNIT